MLRVAILAFVLVLVVPSVQAAPGLATVGVGPRGPAGGGEPYYLRATASEPEAPREAKDTDDCASDERPAGTEHVDALADRLAAWDPLTEFRVSGWYPTCVAATAPSACMGMVPACPLSSEAYASYDVRTGRYYVETRTAALDGADSLAEALGLRPASSAAISTSLTGTTGFGSEADCEYCPPPTSS